MGWRGKAPGRRLGTYLDRRERELGHPVMCPRKQGEHRMVTEAQIRRHCPELIRSKADEVAADVSKFLGRIDERIAERVAEKIEQHVDPQLEELRQVDEELARGLKGLAKRVETIISQSTPIDMKQQE